VKYGESTLTEELPLTMHARDANITDPEVATESEDHDELSRALANLNAGYESLNSALIAVEKALRATGIKLRASACLDVEGIGDGHDKLIVLSYSNYEGEWGLFIESGVDCVSESWDTRPILKAKRELRVKAAESLRELWADLMQQVERERIRTQRAATKAMDFVAHIEAMKRGER